MSGRAGSVLGSVYLSVPWLKPFFRCFAFKKLEVNTLKEMLFVTVMNVFSSVQAGVFLHPLRCCSFLVFLLSCVMAASSSTILLDISDRLCGVSHNATAGIYYLGFLAPKWKKFEAGSIKQAPVVSCCERWEVFAVDALSYFLHILFNTKINIQP